MGATPTGLFPLARAVARGTVKLKDLPEAQRKKVSGLVAAMTPEALRAAKPPVAYRGSQPALRLGRALAR